MIEQEWMAKYGEHFRAISTPDDPKALPHLSKDGEPEFPIVYHRTRQDGKTTVLAMTPPDEDGTSPRNPDRYFKFELSAEAFAALPVVVPAFTVGDPSDYILDQLGLLP